MAVSLKLLEVIILIGGRLDISFVGPKSTCMMNVLIKKVLENVAQCLEGQKNGTYTPVAKLRKWSWLSD
uniref:Uncharacterized protein n=1 Tax=Rhodnius prolixus TaxID=13249 RepID=T1HHH1_RHOPR